MLVEPISSEFRVFFFCFFPFSLGSALGGTLGDRDPLNRVSFEREPRVGLRRIPWKNLRSPLEEFRA